MSSRWSKFDDRSVLENDKEEMEPKISFSTGNTGIQHTQTYIKREINETIENRIFSNRNYRQDDVCSNGAPSLEWEKNYTGNSNFKNWRIQK